MAADELDALREKFIICQELNSCSLIAKNDELHFQTVFDGDCTLSWFRCFGDKYFRIDGASGPTYRVTADDLGAAIQVRAESAQVEGFVSAAMLPAVPMDPAVLETAQLFLDKGEADFKVEPFPATMDATLNLTLSKKNVKIRDGKKTKVKENWNREMQAILSVDDERMFIVRFDAKSPGQTFLAKDPRERDIIVVCLRCFVMKISKGEVVNNIPFLIRISNELTHAADSSSGVRISVGPSPSISKRSIRSMSSSRRVPQSPSCSIGADLERVNKRVGELKTSENVRLSWGKSALSREPSMSRSSVRPSASMAMSSGPPSPSAGGKGAGGGGDGLQRDSEGFIIRENEGMHESIDGFDAAAFGSDGEPEEKTLAVKPIMFREASVREASADDLKKGIMGFQKPPPSTTSKDRKRHKKKRKKHKKKSLSVPSEPSEQAPPIPEEPVPGSPPSLFPEPRTVDAPLPDLALGSSTPRSEPSDAARSESPGAEEVRRPERFSRRTSSRDSAGLPVHKVSEADGAEEKAIDNKSGELNVGKPAVSIAVLEQISVGIANGETTEFTILGEVRAHLDGPSESPVEAFYRLEGFEKLSKTRANEPAAVLLPSGNGELCTRFDGGVRDVAALKYRVDGVAGGHPVPLTVDMHWHVDGDKCELKVVYASNVDCALQQVKVLLTFGLDESSRPVESVVYTMPKARWAPKYQKLLWNIPEISPHCKDVFVATLKLSASKLETRPIQIKFEMPDVLSSGVRFWPLDDENSAGYRSPNYLLGQVGRIALHSKSDEYLVQTNT
eukprot:983813_1